MDHLSSEGIAIGIAWYVVFVMSTTCHEAGHAWMALRLGDPTAYLGGQVSLNPAPHIAREQFGMVIVPILSYLLNGWMIGWASAPYNLSWAMRYPRRAAWMAAAGPAANWILVIMSSVVLWAGLHWGLFVRPENGISLHQVVNGAEEGFATALATLVSIFFSLNLVLGVFNLIPLPPLDGAGMLPLFLPIRAVQRYQDFMSQPGMGMIGLIVAWIAFPRLFPPVLLFVLKLIYFSH